MRIKRYADFTNEEINLRKAIVGGALGASAIFPLSAKDRTSEPLISKDTVAAAVEKSRVDALIDFVNTIENDTSTLFIDGPMTEKTHLSFGQFERIAYLKMRADQYTESTGVHLNLDILTKEPSLFPFRINYFAVRGLDNLDSPTIINILRLDYTAAIKIGGHEVMFNFSRVQDVNTYGMRVNF